MTYNQLIGAVFGGIAPRLLMLSDGRLGKLTKGAMQKISGYEVGSDTPAELVPMLTDLNRLWTRIPRGPKGAFPPFWILAAGRCDEYTPLYLAMSDKDAGYLMRLVLSPLAEGCGPDNIEGTPQPQDAAISHHMETSLKPWLASQIPPDMIETARRAEKTVAQIADELGFTPEDTESIEKKLNASLILKEDHSVSEDEAGILNLGTYLADGKEHSEQEVHALVAELLRRRSERQAAQDAADGTEPESGAAEKQGSEEDTITDFDAVRARKAHRSEAGETAGPEDDPDDVITNFSAVG